MIRVNASYIGILCLHNFLDQGYVAISIRRHKEGILYHFPPRDSYTN